MRQRWEHRRPTSKTPRPTRRVYAFRKKAHYETLEILAFFVVAYVMGSLFFYHMTHPDMTVIQVLYHTLDALLWDW